MSFSFWRICVPSSRVWHRNRLCVVARLRFKVWNFLRRTCASFYMRGFWWLRGAPFMAVRICQNDWLALAPNLVCWRQWLQRRDYGCLVRSTADFMDGGAYLMIPEKTIRLRLWRQSWSSKVKVRVNSFVVNAVYIRPIFSRYVIRMWVLQWCTSWNGQLWSCVRTLCT